MWAWLWIVGGAIARWAGLGLEGGAGAGRRGYSMVGLGWAGLKLGGRGFSCGRGYCTVGLSGRGYSVLWAWLCIVGGAIARWAGL